MALQTANNAICTLQNPIQEDSTVIFLAWNYNRLPTSNFIVEIATFWADNETVIARENILIASRSWNQLIVWERAYEPVPIDDNASENIKQPLAFEIWWTVVKQVVSKALFDEINESFDYINQDITDINNALTDDYVSNAQLQAQKWQPWWIATLDQNGTIPMSEIDTSNLDVTTLNQKFVAWEDISAGDAVCLTTTWYYYTETITLPERMTWWSSQTYTEQTFTLTDIIEWDYFAVYIRMNSTSGQANIRCTITNNWTELYTNTLIWSTTLNEYAVIPCLPWTYTIRFVRSYTYWAASNPIIHYTKRQAATLKKALFSTADTRNNFIWFAIRWALTWEEIAVWIAWNCSTNNSSLIPYQKCYLSTTTAGAITNINTWYCLWTAVSNNIVKIEKNNKILNITNNWWVFTHNMWSQVILAQINGATTFPQVNVYDSNLMFINDVFAITVSWPIMTLKQIYLFE